MVELLIGLHKLMCCSVIMKKEREKKSGTNYPPINIQLKCLIVCNEGFA